MAHNPWRVALLMLAACTSAPSTSGDTDSPDSDISAGNTATVPDTGTDTTDPGTGDTLSADYRVPGPYTVQQWTGQTETSCTMAWTLFRPESPDTDVLVVLAHGFMRGRQQMEGWAEHLASWGLTVVTPELCHATAFDSDHVQNGLDLAALAAAEAPADVLFAGHSAGGLGALLAAEGSLGVLGLDPVDSASLGLQAAPQLGVPAAALVGEPGTCNSQGNGVAMFGAASDPSVVRIPGASHCAFESPTGASCTLFCGDPATPGMTDAIAGLSTAWLLWRAGVDPRGAQWWTPGTAWYDALQADGAFTVP